MPALQQHCHAWQGYLLSPPVPVRSFEALVRQAIVSGIALVCDRLGIDNEKYNVNGGSISIGHPFGMTGARCAGHPDGREHAQRGRRQRNAGHGVHRALPEQRADALQVQRGRVIDGHDEVRVAHGNRRALPHLSVDLNAAM